MIKQHAQQENHKGSEVLQNGYLVPFAASDMRVMDDGALSNSVPSKRAVKEPAKEIRLHGDEIILRGETTRTSDKSVMREFLEATDDTFKFKWPNGNVHYNFGNSHEEGIKFMRNLRAPSQEGNSFVNEYIGGPEVGFSKTFAVKSFRVDNKPAAIGRAINEVEINQFLCHPHCTAFLGTFIAQYRLHLMIYPAACGDLRGFLTTICADRHKRNSKDLSQALSSTVSIQSVLSAAQSEPTGSITLTSNQYHNSAGFVQSNGTIERVNDPFALDLSTKTQMVLGWFQCLASAIEYLHKTADIRHKDIKPENILIDASGMVLITDFGISRQFRPGTTHITNDQWACSDEYASPEVMKGTKVQRGDPSDIFSLGCVFLEMASVVLGKDLDDFRVSRTTEFNATARSSAYHCNMTKVRTWIMNLTSICPGSRLAESLATIEEMLNEVQSARPEADMLWERFKDVSRQRCPDCDKESNTRWKPTYVQEAKTKEAKFKRRSPLAVSGINLNNKLDQLGGVSEESKPNVESIDFAPDMPVMLLDYPGIQDEGDSKIPTFLLRRPTSPINSRNSSLEPSRQARSRSPPVSTSLPDQLILRRKTSIAGPSKNEDDRRRRSSPPVVNSQGSSSATTTLVPTLPSGLATPLSQAPSPLAGVFGSSEELSQARQEYVTKVSSTLTDTVIPSKISPQPTTLVPTPSPVLQTEPRSAPVHHSGGLHRQHTPPPFALPKNHMIIFYDSLLLTLQCIPFDVAIRLASSERRLFKWQYVPQKGHAMNMTNEFGEPIAMVDLSKLKQVSWWKRWRKKYPQVFVLLNSP